MKLQLAATTLAIAFALTLAAGITFGFSGHASAQTSGCGPLSRWTGAVCMGPRGKPYCPSGMTMDGQTCVLNSSNVSGAVVPVAEQPRAARARTMMTLSCPSRCANSSFSSIYQAENGICTLKANVTCFPSICDGAAGVCRAAVCLSDHDCAAGAGCNTVTGTCAPVSYQCADSQTVISSLGYTTSCAPFQCNAGACKTSK